MEIIRRYLNQFLEGRASGEKEKDEVNEEEEKEQLVKRRGSRWKEESNNTF